MKIAVINGSPKGPLSITMQYVRFLQKRFPQHEFVVLDVCHELKRLEDDPRAFREAIGTVQNAAAVLWATPVYVLLVPGPYKRFIELVFERSAESAFQGKHAAVLTTSMRFFDYTAHNYLHAICDDLGMHFLGAYGAEMYDLLRQVERARFLQWWEAILKDAGEERPTQRAFDPVVGPRLVYAPAMSPPAVSGGGKRIVVLSDGQGEGNVPQMVAKLCSCFHEPVEVIELVRIKMLGGCRGCIQCGQDNVCVYGDADDVCASYRKLEAADIIIEAATIRDRFLSARWKTFRDRGFFHNHIPWLRGKQIGYLISGPLRQVPNVRQILEAAVEVQQANLVDIVTDECHDSQELDRLLEHFAGRLVQSDQREYIHPSTFLGRAARKLLRDEIWKRFRIVFAADHHYYRRHHLYDFPRRSLKWRWRDTLVGIMLKFPSFRKQFRSRIRTEMIKPLERVVEEE